MSLQLYIPNPQYLHDGCADWFQIFLFFFLSIVIMHRILCYFLVKIKYANVSAAIEFLLSTIVTAVFTMSFLSLMTYLMIVWSVCLM